MSTNLPYDAVVLDLEGTIIPISFVYDTLFPYAHEHVERFVTEHWDDLDVQKDIAELRALSEDEAAGGMKVTPIPAHGKAPATVIRDAVVAFVRALMNADRKDTALKALQGKIWRDGYERGQLKGEFYDDALRALARWVAADVVLAIYSSGSIEAQQLLFKYSTEGDMTDWIAAWFDTTTGPKRAAASYDVIAGTLEIEASRIRFYTDVVAEGVAAHEAGFQVVIMERMGNPKQPAHDFMAEEDLDLV